MELLKKAFNKFSLLLFYKFFYRQHNNKIEVDEIVVVGRGESANYYFNKFKNSPRIIGLVNFTDRDLKNINLQFIKKKEIYLFFNIEGNSLSIRNLLKLNIKGIIRTSNEENIQRLKKFNNLNIIQKLYLKSFPKYPSHLNKFFYLGNSGLLSIAYMIDLFNPKRVLLFGFNFYQNKMIRNYLPQENVYSKELIALKKEGENLKNNFLKLCKYFKKIEFYHYDEIKLEELPNLNFINIREIDK